MVHMMELVVENQSFTSDLWAARVLTLLHFLANVFNCGLNKCEK